MAVGLAASRGRFRLIDIGANLTDPMFQGVYHRKPYHHADLDAVLERSSEAGVEKIIITGGSLSDCKASLDLAKTKPYLYTTVGCHPTRCGEFESTEGVLPRDYLHQLLQLVKDNKDKVVAIGECGLDYDRLHFCNKGLQLKYFEMQLEMAQETCLPLFLHCRNSFEDFIDILKRNRDKITSGGVVHSFDGSLAEAHAFIDMGLYIGINGCSLKTDTNLSVVKQLPVDKLLLETDAPWCEIRPTHSSYKYVTTHHTCKKKEKWEPGFGVKSRNEPRNMIQVLEVVAKLQGRDLFETAERVYSNSINLFSF